MHLSILSTLSKPVIEFSSFCFVFGYFPLVVFAQYQKMYGLHRSKSDVLTLYVFIFYFFDSLIVTTSGERGLRILILLVKETR